MIRELIEVESKRNTLYSIIRPSNDHLRKNVHHNLAMVADNVPKKKQDKHAVVLSKLIATCSQDLY